MSSFPDSSSDDSQNNKSRFVDDEAEDLLTAMKEVVAGIATGSSHVYWHAKNALKSWLVLPAMKLAGLGDSDTSSEAAGSGTLEVIGVGYGRTGTYSLTLALEELGHKTLHTQHMYETASILDMWDELIFKPALASGQASLGAPDFDLIARVGYSATTDLPMSLYFEQMVEKYPDSKFILTTRGSSEEWWRSWDMLTRTITEPTRWFRWMSHAVIFNRYYRWLFARINNDDKYLSAPLPLPPQNKEAAIASYEAHNQRVRQVIPPERLLEYNVKQGWEPLCQFLEISECPTSPFPKTNSARSVQMQSVSAMTIPIAVVVIVLYYFLRTCGFIQPKCRKKHKKH
jgi:hypothetical protein